MSDLGDEKWTGGVRDVATHACVSVSLCDAATYLDAAYPL